MAQNELELLKARMDVMQKYLNDSVQGIQKDFETLFDSIVKALNMMDARLTAVEFIVAPKPAEPLEVAESGKEL